MSTTAKRMMMAAAALALWMSVDFTVASAQEQGQPSAIGQLASGLNPANWRMPEWKMPNFRSLLPSNDEKARIKKKKDGLFDEVGKTASNSWSKTKETLNPQKLNPVNFFTASARTPAPSPTRESKPGFFRSLLTGPEPEQETSTVTEFLSQSRPSP